MDDVTAGSRVSYEDMANPRRYGTVVGVDYTTWGRQLAIRWDDGDHTTTDGRQAGWRLEPAGPAPAYFGPDDADREQQEYWRLNDHLRALTEVRRELGTTMLLPPIAEPVARRPGGHPDRAAQPGGPAPRNLYAEAQAAIVAAEHAIMRCRDRGSWQQGWDRGHRQPAA